MALWRYTTPRKERGKEYFFFLLPGMGMFGVFVSPDPILVYVF